MAPFGEGSSFLEGVRNCRSQAHEDQCLIHWRKFLPFLMLFLKIDSMITIKVISTYPATFCSIFSSLGAFGLATIWHDIFFFWKNKNYLMLHLYLPGVQIKLMNSFVSLPILWSIVKIKLFDRILFTILKHEIEKWSK